MFAPANTFYVYIKSQVYESTGIYQLNILNTLSKYRKICIPMIKNVAESCSKGTKYVKAIIHLFLINNALCLYLTANIHIVVLRTIKNSMVIQEHLIFQIFAIQK